MTATAIPPGKSSGVTAGPFQDLAAEIDNEAGLLGDLRELAGGHRTERRMAPPGQGFHPADLPGADVHLDLIVGERSDRLGDGVRQFGLDRGPAEEDFAHGRVEAEHPALARHLGLGQGDVGIDQQIVGIAPRGTLMAMPMEAPTTSRLPSMA